MAKSKDLQSRVSDRELSEADKAIISQVRKLLHHFRMERTEAGLEYVRDNRFHWLGSHWQLEHEGGHFGKYRITRVEPGGKPVGVSVDAEDLLASWAKQARKKADSEDGPDREFTEFDELVNSLIKRERICETHEERQAALRKAMEAGG